MPDLIHHPLSSHISLDDEDHQTCVIMHREMVARRVRWPCSGQDPLVNLRRGHLHQGDRELLVGRLLPLEGREMRNPRAPCA